MFSAAIINSHNGVHAVEVYNGTNAGSNVLDWAGDRQITAEPEVVWVGPDKRKLVTITGDNSTEPLSVTARVQATGQVLAFTIPSAGDSPDPDPIPGPGDDERADSWIARITPLLAKMPGWSAVLVVFVLFLVLIWPRLKTSLDRQDDAAMARATVRNAALQATYDLQPDALVVTVATWALYDGQDVSRIYAAGSSATEDGVLSVCDFTRGPDVTTIRVPLAAVPGGGLSRYYVTMEVSNTSAPPTYPVFRLIPDWGP